MNEDFEILEELLDTIEQLGQRNGKDPGSYLSSSQKLRQDLVKFGDDCRQSRINGKARKRRSGSLFRRIISLIPDVWKK